ncbi:MAG: hypothetical protein AAFR16_05635, partial [Pseudomonadota bacterium]
MALIGAAALGAAGGLPAGRAAAEGWSGGGVRSLGESLLGPPKYGDDFSRFDYVNPAAPKGGSVRLFGGRTYDSFNPYIIKGAPTTAASLHVWVEAVIGAAAEQADGAAFGRGGVHIVEAGEVV